MGDTIQLGLLNKSFKVDILEVKPAIQGVNAICVVEADVEVDFAEPLDYQEHLVKQQQKAEMQK